MKNIKILTSLVICNILCLGISVSAMRSKRYNPKNNIYNHYNNKQEDTSIQNKNKIKEDEKEEDEIDVMMIDMGNEKKSHNYNNFKKERNNKLNTKINLKKDSEEKNSPDYSEKLDKLKKNLDEKIKNTKEFFTEFMTTILKKESNYAAMEDSREKFENSMKKVFKKIKNFEKLKKQKLSKDLDEKETKKINEINSLIKNYLLHIQQAEKIVYYTFLSRTDQAYNEHIKEDLATLYEENNNNKNCADYTNIMVENIKSIEEVKEFDDFYKKNLLRSENKKEGLDETLDKKIEDLTKNKNTYSNKENVERLTTIKKNYEESQHAFLRSLKNIKDVNGRDAFYKISNKLIDICSYNEKHFDKVKNRDAAIVQLLRNIKEEALIQQNNIKEITINILLNESINKFFEIYGAIENCDEKKFFSEEHMDYFNELWKEIRNRCYKFEICNSCIGNEEENFETLSKEKENIDNFTLFLKTIGEKPFIEMLEKTAKTNYKDKIFDSLYHTAKINSYQTKLEILNAKKNSVHENIEDLKYQEEEFMSCLDKLNEKIKKLEDRLNSLLKEKNKKNNNELKYLKDKIKNYKKEIKNIENKINNLENEINNLPEQEEIQDKNIKNFTEKCRTVFKEIKTEYINSCLSIKQKNKKALTDMYYKKNKLGQQLKDFGELIGEVPENNKIDNKEEKIDNKEEFYNKEKIYDKKQEQEEIYKSRNGEYDRDENLSEPFESENYSENEEENNRKITNKKMKRKNKKHRNQEIEDNINDMNKNNNIEKINNIIDNIDNMNEENHLNNKEEKENNIEEKEDNIENNIENNNIEDNMNEENHLKNKKNNIKNNNNKESVDNISQVLQEENNLEKEEEEDEQEEEEDEDKKEEKNTEIIKTNNIGEERSRSRSKSKGKNKNRKKYKEDKNKKENVKDSEKEDKKKDEEESIDSNESN